jgi:hypothetical protein
MKYTYSDIKLKKEQIHIDNDVVELMEDDECFYNLVWSNIVNIWLSGMPTLTLKMPKELSINHLYFRQKSQGNGQMSIIVSSLPKEHLPEWGYKKTVGVIESPKMDARDRQVVMNNEPLRLLVYSLIAQFKVQRFGGWMSAPVPDEFVELVGREIKVADHEKGGYMVWFVK